MAAFEAEIAATVGRRHAVAVSSGTVALQLALQAIGVEQRRVLMPTYVCTALLHATWGAGGTPVLADVDGRTGNIEAVPGQPWDAAILPHMFGRPATAAAALASQGPVIEDLAMALGAQAGTDGVVCVCSFYATKVITSGGEGGMVLTDDEGLADTVRQLREYDGRAADRVRSNAKMTDLAAAVGRVQLRRLPELLQRRRELAQRYDECLRALGVDRVAAVDGENHYRYIVHIPSGAASMIDRMQQHGVSARVPVDRLLHQHIDARESYPGAESMLHSALSLPLYPAMTETEVERVLDASQQLLPTHSTVDA